MCIQNNISTMSHLHWFACPGWPAVAARGPRPRPWAGPSLQLLSSLEVTTRPPILYPGSDPGIEKPPVLYTGSAQSSLELSLTAITPQKDSFGLDPAMQTCSFVWNVFWSAWRLKGRSNPRKVLFLFILFCVTFIALAFSPRLTIRYLFCQHTGFYCYKCRDTQVWIVWKMKQYFPKLLKTFC